MVALEYFVYIKPILSLESGVLKWYEACEFNQDNNLAIELYVASVRKPVSPGFRD